MFEIANHIEAGFWALVGLAFLCHGVIRGGPSRMRRLAAGILFILFGGSDVVEAGTGAWWRPWWLLAWKGACLLGLLLLLRDYARRRPR
jgi:hypothetical protein